MRVLLDTCTALWVALGSSELSSRARRLFRDPGNTCYLSAVSAWEIGVNHALGKLELPEPPESFVPELRRRGRIESLPLEEAATLHLPRLPVLHRDPFDRMLVCQAIAGGLVLLTPDPDIRRYPVSTEW